MAPSGPYPNYAAVAATPGPPHTRLPGRYRKKHFWSVPRWKNGLKWDFIVTFIILIFHLVFLIVVQSRSKADGDFWGDYGFEVFSSRTDCNQLEHERAGWSMAVNTMAALIGTFSSATLQALSAPTRRQLDECHKDRSYMEIGVQSFHNIWKPYLGWPKRTLWVLLMLMTLPFHILYNSVVVLSIPAAESYQVTLSDSFFTHARESTDSILNPPGSKRSEMRSDLGISYVHGRDNGISPSFLATVNTLGGAASSSPDPLAYLAGYQKTPYEISPFVAWTLNTTTNATDPLQWPGINTVTKDLESLLANTNISDPNLPSGSIFKNIAVLSPDWSWLTFDECMHTFGIYYRPYAGTVALVVSEGEKIGPSSNALLTRQSDNPVQDYLNTVCFPDTTYPVVPPCQEIVNIENACKPNGTSTLFLQAHAQCMCHGSFFSDWIGCLNCDYVHGARSEQDVDAYNRILTSASHALCTGTPTASFAAIFSSVNNNGIVGVGSTDMSDQYPSETAIDLYYTPTGVQGPGVITGSPTAATAKVTGKMTTKGGSTFVGSAGPTKIASSGGSAPTTQSGFSNNDVLGLNYLSYRAHGLGVVCPEYFIDSTPGAQGLITQENPPTLPLLFGTFSERGSRFPKVFPSFSGPTDLCPSYYPGLADYNPEASRTDIPTAQGCLLRVRGSKCRLGYNVVFFTIVSVALGFKLLLLSFALLVVTERPILTVGDAIAEYLEREDMSTAGCSLEFTRAEGLKVRGPVETYQVEASTTRTSNINSTHNKEKSWNRRWREIWPSKGDGRQEAVPKWDIINYSASMKSRQTFWWLLLHIFTLSVSAGIFSSIYMQSGWIVSPQTKKDKYWMMWPCFLVNLPQLFATFRSFEDNKILTSRNSFQEFASYATAAQGLRVSHPARGSAQRDPYFFGNMNFLVYVSMTGLQVLYTFILSQLVVPQWINPLNPGQDDNYFSPSFLMRFGSLESRPMVLTVFNILLITFFPFLGVHIVNTVSSLVVRVRVLKIAELSTFLPQYICDMFCIPSCLRPGKGDIIETTHLLPSIPLQMPGPATNSLAISVACHAKPKEAGTGLSYKLLKWGVVRRPSPGFERATSPTLMRRDPDTSEEDMITFSPILHEAPSYAEKTPASPQRPSPTSPHSTFSIKRKPLSTSTFISSHVIELVREDSKEEWDLKDADVGHCTFSAEEVDELEPGRQYSGIRHDEDHALWVKGGSLGFKRIFIDLMVRMKPRRKAGYKMPPMASVNV